MNETHLAYEELHVHVSAETFEKVDEAVALIELLITSVSVSLTILKINIFIFIDVHLNFTVWT